jgi:hypothetical protein
MATHPVVDTDVFVPVVQKQVVSRFASLVTHYRAVQAPYQNIGFWGGSNHLTPPFYDTEQSVPAGGYRARVLGSLGFSQQGVLLLLTLTLSSWLFTFFW